MTNLISKYSRRYLSISRLPSLSGTMATSSSGTSPVNDPLVQYIVLRKDLWQTDAQPTPWPLGSIVAQACHASTAAIQLFSQDPITIQYFSDVDHMHKVVLEVKDEEGLRSLSAKLEEAGVHHKLWVEQPEGFATALATKPSLKSTIAPHFKKLQLCKTKLGS